MSEGVAELIETRLAATEPRSWRLGTQTLMTGGVAGLAVLALFAQRWGLPTAVSVAVPWLLVLGLLGTSWLVGKRQRALRRDILAASDHGQLEQWGAAVDILNRVMRRPIRPRSLRGEAFLLWATLAERDRHFEDAARLYEALLLRRIGDATQLQRANIALAGAKLRIGELADAVDLIGRLERVPMPRPLRALCDLIRLYQQVSMGHMEDAVSNMEERRAAFRRDLSTQAGYAYALLAAARHHLGQADEAGRLWRDATLLIKPERLVWDFDLLRSVSAAYAAAEHPV
ncbi:MAG: hypothetical protein ACE5F9_04995 [Phycisphaerae bacterium]